MNGCFLGSFTLPLKIGPTLAERVGWEGGGWWGGGGGGGGRCIPLGDSAWWLFQLAVEKLLLALGAWTIFQLSWTNGCRKCSLPYVGTLFLAF